MELYKDHRWWGYKHVNGTLHVKRYFDQRDLDEAQGSPFVARVCPAFFAKNRTEALTILEGRDL